MPCFQRKAAGSASKASQMQKGRDGLAQANDGCVDVDTILFLMRNDVSFLLLFLF
jgi:hypothetical protein